MAVPTLALLPRPVARRYPTLPIIQPLVASAWPFPSERNYRHDFSAEIELGVATLDAELTRDVWLPRVNLASLDVEVEDTCVVGQTTLNVVFYEGVELLRGPSINLKDSDEKVDEQVDRLYAWSDARGFTVSNELCDEHGEKLMFRQLTDQWVAKIAELRAEVAK